jgi:hypothetical protein
MRVADWLHAIKLLFELARTLEWCGRARRMARDQFDKENSAERCGQKAPGGVFPCVNSRKPSESKLDEAGALAEMRRRDLVHRLNLGFVAVSLVDVGVVIDFRFLRRDH